MSLKDEVQSALEAVLAECSDHAVAVEAKGASATGLRAAVVQGADLMQAGVEGETTGRVRIVAGVLSVAEGDVITVAGVECRVRGLTTDHSGGTVAIDYTELQA